MSTRTTLCYVGLGSNLNDPVQQIRAALGALAAIPGTCLVKQSQFYRSAPLFPPPQPDYINAVVALSTQLTPHKLLTHLQAIEAQQGRQRTHERYGPRSIDLDLLLYGAERINTAKLIVPHPGLTGRNFVLYPLAEIAPDLILPSEQKLRELLLDFSAPNIEKTNESAVLG